MDSLISTAEWGIRSLVVLAAAWFALDAIDLIYVVWKKGADRD